MKGWRTTLERQALDLFDRFVMSADPGEGNPQRIYQAQITLRKNLRGRKLRNELDLPEFGTNQMEA